MNRYLLTSAGTLFFALALFLLLFPPLPAFSLEAAERIQLDADKISFLESTGVATAEGNVRIYNQEMRLYAPFVEYDSESQQVKALSSQDGFVTFQTAQGSLSGERLDYNILSRTGTLTHPSGKVDAFYVRGELIEVMPAADVIGKKVERSEMATEEELAARWSSASLTTCNRPAPHYRLEAREITVIPGRRLIIRKPRVYLGQTMIMAYPFDYIVPLTEQDRRSTQRLFPKIGYESDMGAGLGVGGSFAWDSGTLDLEIIGWTEGIWEGDALLKQEIAPNLFLFGETTREYDKDRDITEWRPKWGLDYTWKGWQMEAGWSQRELVSVEKRAGTDSRYVVWRKPEINIISPWYEDRATSGHFRFLGTWGKYEDATFGASDTVERMGAGLHAYGEFGVRKTNFQPFYNALYWYYYYDDDDHDKQQILDAVVGVRWFLGEFDMETAYLRRWTWGNSPMYWDDYEPREDIYQEIGYRIPTSDREISWKLGLRAAYSLRDEELAEMVYKVAYDQHCLLWEAIYRDDRRGSDDWFGLTLTIKAYPESGVRLSGDDLFEPSKAPNDLVPNLY